jgi:hypothetical protein
VGEREEETELAKFLLSFTVRLSCPCLSSRMCFLLFFFSFLIRAWLHADMRNNDNNVMAVVHVATKQIPPDILSHLRGTPLARTKTEFLPTH